MRHDDPRLPPDQESPDLTPHRRRRDAARKRRAGTLFFALYLGALIAMAAAALGRLQPGRLADAVTLAPIALVWLVMFAAALRELLRFLRRARRGGADDGGQAAPTPEAPAPVGQQESVSEQEEFRHYAALQLSPGATFAEIRKAYKRLGNAWRPDRAAKDDLASRRIAEEKMRAIEAAYAYFRNKFGK